MLERQPRDGFGERRAERGVLCAAQSQTRRRVAGAGLFATGLEPDQITERDALKLIKPLLEDRGVLKIAQNLKFDLQIFALRGIDVTPCDDTMLMSYVLDAGRSDHGLDPLSGVFSTIRPIQFGDVAGSRSIAR